MLNGKLLGWCPTRSYIDVETSTRSLYLEFGELSDIPICSYKDNIDRDSSYQMKRFTVGAMTTPKYYGWWSKRVN
ncbi:hypothetical protein Gotur_021553, partial [Gossypium turneri]